MKLATDIACRAVSSLEGAGIFAVELFLTGDGQVYDNFLKDFRVIFMDSFLYLMFQRLIFLMF